MKKPLRSVRVTHVSHACIKYEWQGGCLLSDPWLLNEPVYSYAQWKFPAAVIPPEEALKGVNYIYLTHSHEDHFHVPSLDRVSRDMMFLLPEYTHHSSIRAQTIERCLRAMGFHRIRKLHPWQTFMMSGDVPLISVPSAPTRDHDWENSGFIIDHPKCRLINMNDNISDESLCHDIHARYPEFDIGFIQTAGVSIFPACFKMPEAEIKDAIEKKINNFSEQDRLISMLKLKRAVPIAGDFGWLNDRHFDYNFTGRATPLFLEDHIRQTYPDCEAIRMYPSDTWTIEDGHERNHPEIDWAHYLDHVRKVQTKFRYKVDHYDQWIDESSRERLKERTQERIDLVNHHIAQDYIDFTARFRVTVEGPRSNFSMVLSAHPKDGFCIRMDDPEPVDQTNFVPERIWAAVLEGKVMWNMICWTMKIQEHVPFRPDLGRFWSWVEYYLDLGNKNTQAIIEPSLFGQQTPLIRPQWGVIERGDDWDLSWLKNET